MCSHRDAGDVRGEKWTWRNFAGGVGPGLGNCGESGILGMNRRNAAYILPHNPRKYFARVDDKLLTKQICEKHGIPVPHTYAVIERQGDVRRIGGDSGRSRRVRGEAHAGERRPRHPGDRCDVWRTGGSPRETIEIPSPDMQYHLSAILAGLYSLGGRPDRAVIEERIKRHGGAGARGGRRHARHSCGRVPERTGHGHGPPAHPGVAGPSQSAPGRCGCGNRTAHAAAPPAACATRASPTCTRTRARRSRDSPFPIGANCWRQRCAWRPNWNWAMSASISYSTRTADPSSSRPTHAPDWPSRSRTAADCCIGSARSIRSSLRSTPPPRPSQVPHENWDWSARIAET